MVAPTVPRIQKSNYAIGRSRLSLKRTNVYRLAEVLIGVVRGFSVGYGYKVAVAIAFSLIKGRFKLKKLNDFFCSAEAIRFGKFLATMLFIYRGSKLIMQKIIEKVHPMAEKDERQGKIHYAYDRVRRLKMWNGNPWLETAAGFLSGLSLFVLPPEERFTAALYTAFRSLGDMCKFLVHVKKYPALPMSDLLGFTLSTLAIVYGFATDHSLIDETYLRFLQWCAGLPGFSGMELAGRCNRDGSPIQGDFTVRFIPPSPYSNEGYCLYIVKSISRGFIRSLQVYVKVHVLASILRIGKALKKPKRFFLEKATNLFWSSCFLTMYGVHMKVVLLASREYTKAPAKLSTILFAGFCAGMSALYEHPRRKDELSLYCIPRAWQILLNVYIKKYGGPTSLLLRHAQLLNVVAFQCGIAMWLYIVHRLDFYGQNGLNEALLRTVFGVRTPSPRRPSERPIASLPPETVRHAKRNGYDWP